MDETRSGPTLAAPDTEHDLWRMLAEAASVEQFCTAWLGLQAPLIGGVAGGLVVLERAGDLQVVAVWPAAYAGAEKLAGAVERATSERRGAVTRADDGSDALLLAFPIRVGSRLAGAAAFEIGARPQIQLQSAMRQLQWGTAWLQNWVLRTAATPGERQTKRMGIVLEIGGLALEAASFRGAATSTVTELGSRLECDRVSLGFLAGKQVKVQALSHSAQFGKQMNLIRAIATAMAEAIDQQTVLVWPADGRRRQHVIQAHESLARDHGDAAVLTVPFSGADGRAFGALTFERAVAEPFDDSTVELCDSAAALLGPILEEKRRNDRLLVAKVWDSLWRQVKRFVGPGYAGRKIAALLLAALAVFFFYARGAYRVTAETTLEGEVQRVVTAPFRGFIFEAPVRGGDLVRAGQTMASLDVRDLRLELAKWSTEREQHAMEHRRAMAERDRAAMNVLSKKMRQAEAQVSLLDEQVTRATITAPFDGLVVRGDLSQALGAPVEPGQVLFEVAPLESYRLKLEVDEREIDEVREGQPGELILTSMPETRLTFKVSKITPVSQSEEGRNYFNVEGRLDQVSERLRPGMQGYAKIDVDRRRLIWIWTHQLIDWARVRLWRWLP